MEHPTNNYEFTVIKLKGVFSTGDCVSNITLTGIESGVMIHGAQHSASSTQILLGSADVTYKAKN